MNPRTIWLYWEGSRPAYIDLCIKTVFAHNDNVMHLDWTGFDRLFVEERELPVNGLALNHKSDFIRAFLLYHYGGLYLDADCIVLRNLGAILDATEQTGFAGYREPQGYMSCNLMASVPRAEVISEHYHHVCEAVRSRRPLEWLDLASVPMNQAIAAHPGKAQLFPTELIMPLPWNESPHLSIRRHDEGHRKFFQNAAYCYMLSNNTIKSSDHSRIICYLPEEHLLQDRYFISYLFRQALNLAY